MLSINTNISSLIAQNSLNQSTNKLNQAIERMTTGAKINHAKDNAANYSINTNMTTKIGAYRVAEENTAMGMDMVATASENLDQMQNHATRLRALATQARNGTYGGQSLNAIQSEADALVNEMERIYKSAVFDGSTLFKNVESSKFMKEIIRRDTSEMTRLESVDENTALTSGVYSISTAEELAKLATMTNNGLIGQNTEFVLANDIDLSEYDNWTPIGKAIFNADNKIDNTLSKPFTASFDGNGFTVSNLKCNNPENKVSGLFGYINNSSRICNLGITDFDIKATFRAGGLSGILNYSIVENVYINNSVVTAEYMVGGLAGQATSTKIVDTWVENVEIYLSKSIFGAYYSGVMVGYSYSGKLENCLGIGKVKINSPNNNDRSGTLIGFLEEAADVKNGYVKNCIGIADIYFNGIEQSTTLGNISSPIENSFSYKKNSVNINDFLPKTSRIINDINDIQKRDTKLMVGINSNSECIDLNLDVSLYKISLLKNFKIDSNDAFKTITEIEKNIEQKQTELGSVSNRLDSVLDEISIQYENLVSSRSTIRDADMAEVSSTYIQQQILQEASATLLATTKNIQYQNVLGLLQSLRG